MSDRCAQCGGAAYSHHDFLGWLCWFHMALTQRFRGKD